MLMQGVAVNEDLAEQWSKDVYKNTSTRAVAEFKEMEKVNLEENLHTVWKMLKWYSGLKKFLEIDNYNAVLRSYK